MGIREDERSREVTTRAIDARTGGMKIRRSIGQNESGVPTDDFHKRKVLID